MNFEKGLLIAGVVFLVIMITILAMHRAMREEQFAVEKMFIPADYIVKSSGGDEAFRYTLPADPFQEDSGSVKVEVNIDLPAGDTLPLLPPPVFWNKEAF